MKKVLLLLMSFFLCFCIIDKSDCEIKAYSNYRVLSVPNFQQSNSNTCWVAVGTAILHSKGYLITYVQYRNACGVTYDRTATIYEIRRGFIAYNQSHSTAITG